MNKNTVFIQSNSKITIPMTLISQESSKLMVLLPGVGYTVDSPLFHYLRTVGVNHGYDILSVKYDFQVTGQSSTGGQHDAPYQDSKKAIESVWQSRYESLCLVGKSFGTSIASRLIHEIDTAQKSLILLTPIGNAPSAAKTVRTMAIIGTQDHYYDEKIIQATPNILWHVLDGLNHSLEIKGDWQASLQKMAIIMGYCEDFLAT